MKRRASVSLSHVDSEALVDASVGPRGSLENLSQSEIEHLLTAGQGGIHPLFRNCALAVLTSGSEADNAKEIFDRYGDFDMQLVRHAWGIKLEIQQRAGQCVRRRPDDPRHQGTPVRGAARRRLHLATRSIGSGRFDLDRPDSRSPTPCSTCCATRGFSTTRSSRTWSSAGAATRSAPVEYQYTKKVGYELGLRGLDVCTGCGPGAMKGPMKGATIGHAKQRISDGRYIGLTEPGIIAAEPPNPIVNQLVIMPDIEKRLEAFVRLRTASWCSRAAPARPRKSSTCSASCSIRPTPSSRCRSCSPGPSRAADYFEQIQRFIGARSARPRANALHVIVDDPAEVAASHGATWRRGVRDYRRASNDSYNFNWLLQDPAGRSSIRSRRRTSRCAGCELHRDQPAHRAGREPAPRVLRHRRRQREGTRRAGDRSSSARTSCTATRS